MVRLQRIIKPITLAVSVMVLHILLIIEDIPLMDHHLGMVTVHTISVILLMVPVQEPDMIEHTIGAILPTEHLRDIDIVHTI